MPTCDTPLAYLAVTSRAHSRASLATLLWGNVDDQKANSSQRNAPYVLRRELGWELCLIAGRHQMRIESGQFWLDIDRLRLAVREEAESIPALSDGLALWRGPFLDPLFVTEAPGFYAWVRATRESLDRTYLVGCLALSRAHAQAEQWPDALAAAWKAVALDPLYEAAHRQIIRIHLRMGSWSAALRQYERCRVLLESELGVLPSARTQALHEQVQTGEVRRVRHVAQQGSAQPQSVFVGSRREMAVLDEHLEGVRRTGSGRLVLVEGEAGVGTT